MGFSLHPGGHGHSHSVDNNSGDFEVDEEKLRLTRSESIQDEAVGSYGSLSNSYSGITCLIIDIKVLVEHFSVLVYLIFV